MSNKKRRMLVTTALPYANGPLHLGHMLEQVQSDIWCRFQRKQGHDCYFIGADDTHGTPIMIKAQSLGVSVDDMLATTLEDHKNDLNGFNISFDNYYTTNSKESKELVEIFYHKLNDKGFIIKDSISQLYDVEKEMFLSDRFVQGTCPKCGSENQYGDHCDNCSAIYNAIDLKDPVSVLTGTVPVVRNSEHYFFNLPVFADKIKDWIASGALQKEVANKLQEWFEVGLKPWDISRDAPYFGFQIPGESNKYFYVWLDAPIGYLSSFKNFCEKNDINFQEFWQQDTDTELHHFVGKDIINFHCLFWPAILDATELRKPTSVFSHGYLTVNQKKMSKSKGTFITARNYLDNLPSDCLRYYFASKLTPKVEDIDLNLLDFETKVNSDLVGKVVNLASRTAKFINGSFENKICKVDDVFFGEYLSAKKTLEDYYEQKEYNKAVRLIMSLVDNANSYISDEAPWVLMKDGTQESKDRAWVVCSNGLNIFRILMIYLSPVVPDLFKKTQDLFNDELAWLSVDELLHDHEINKFKPMLNRINVESLSS